MSGGKEELRKRAREEGGFRDDFEERSPYWDWRVDGYAGFEVKDSVLRLYTGPTEALYYSNAEISDGSFGDLPWSRKTFEAKVRLRNLHYGSAGWGFWNYTMVIDDCVPIWFIYLRARGPYVLNGFFAQVGAALQPIVLFEKPASLRLAYLLSKISEKLAGVKIPSLKPSMPDLNLEEWHVYRIEWRDRVRFYVDDRLVADLPVRDGVRARADAWIDNAVFVPERRGPGRVYRHSTQENRRRAYLEIDYIAVY